MDIEEARARMLQYSVATRISEETRASIAAVWHDLLDTVASGAEIGKAIEAAGISANAIRAYRRDDAEAAAEWESARVQSADSLADDILATINNPAVDPAYARVRVDALKWLASKRNPRAYSDRAMLDVNVRAVDLTRIIGDANARLALQRAHVLNVSPLPELLPAPGADLF